MSEKYPKFSEEHIIIRELIKESGKIALKWFKDKPRVWKKEDGTDAVSYTHLTLPTTLSV